MKHSVVYLGYYPQAVDRQRPGVLAHIAKDGTVRPADKPNVDGVLFGCMEDADANGGKKFVATRALYNDIDVVLDTPIPFNPHRHTDGKGFGPQPPRFEDTSAEQLLSDMVEANPRSAEQLRQIATRAGLTLSL